MSEDVNCEVPGNKTVLVLMAARFNNHHSGILGKIIIAREMGPSFKSPEARIFESWLKSLKVHTLAVSLGQSIYFIEVRSPSKHKQNFCISRCLDGTFP